MANHLVLPHEDQLVLTRAADAGFHLEQCETDTGQLVWAWQRGNGPRPQFVTRRVAIDWMAKFLTRDHPAFVSNFGSSYSSDSRRGADIGAR
jgi:hypothetical protein